MFKYSDIQDLMTVPDLNVINEEEENDSMNNINLFNRDNHAQFS